MGWGHGVWVSGGGSHQRVTGTPLVSLSGWAASLGQEGRSQGPGETPGTGEEAAFLQPSFSGISLWEPLLRAQPVGVGDTASCHPQRSRGSVSTWKFAGRKGCRGGVGIRNARGPGPASTCGSDLWPATDPPSGPELSDPLPGLGPPLFPPAHLPICPSHLPAPPWSHLYRNSFIRLGPPPPHS